MTRVSLVLVAIACLGVAACGKPPTEPRQNDERAEGRVVELLNASGEPLGEIRMSEDGNGTTLAVKVAGLDEGLHGAHLHEVGLCQGPTFESAGGHWNPTDMQHGRDNPAGSHVGDLSNLGINQDGEGTATYLVPGVLSEGTADQFADDDGTALIIHTGPDDYQTDPSGNSGARVACAVLAPSR